MAQITTRSIEANGLRFQIDEAGEGDQVALLLHGFPQSRQCWRHQLGALAELGWRAVTPDLRGYGESSRPKGRGAYRIEHLVDDVSALFDALGAKRRLLIGHDWGGMIAWSVAARRAAALDGLIVLNAPHPVVFAQAVRHGEQRRKSWYVRFFQLPWLPERKLGKDGAAPIGRLLRRSSAREDTFPDEVIARYCHNAAQPGALTAMINYYRANRNVAAMADGPGVDTPVLLLWGEQDLALGAELIEPSARFAEDVTVQRFPDASHWLPEEAPEEVNAAIGNWLINLA